MTGHFADRMPRQRVSFSVNGETLELFLSRPLGLFHETMRFDIETLRILFCFLIMLSSDPTTSGMFTETPISDYDSRNKSKQLLWPMYHRKI